MTFSAFDSQPTVFGIAKTNAFTLFNAEGNHAERATFTPPNFESDREARPAISRGATVGFYESDCVVDTATTQKILWNEF